MNCAPQQTAVVKNVVAMVPGDYEAVVNERACVSVCIVMRSMVIVWELMQRQILAQPRRPLIVWLCNKSNVSREIIYTSAVM